MSILYIVCGYMLCVGPYLQSIYMFMFLPIHLLFCTHKGTIVCDCLILPNSIFIVIDRPKKINDFINLYFMYGMYRSIGRYAHKCKYRDIYIYIYTYL